MRNNQNITTLEDEFWRSVVIKDFRGEDEFFVREEFLLPLFRSVGYDGFGIRKVERGVNLNASSLNQPRKSSRRHIFPDFVLSFRGIPLIVADAKTPRKKLSTKENLGQLLDYSIRLGCPAALLSNGLETIGYKRCGTTLAQIFNVTFEDIVTKGWTQITNFLDASRQLDGLLSLRSALSYYFTDDYMERSLLMAVLQAQPSREVLPLLKEKRFTKFGPSDFRGRALPAILIQRHAKKDVGLFLRIFESSLSDSDCIVRENLFTCLDSICESVLSRSTLARKLLTNFEPTTLLERVLFLRIVKRCALSVSSSKIRHISSNIGSWFHRYIAIKNYFSLPFNIILGRPATVNYREYVEMVDALPAFFGDIVDDKFAHPETFKVISSCLLYSQGANQMLYRRFFSAANLRQRGIITNLLR